MQGEWRTMRTEKTMRTDETNNGYTGNCQNTNALSSLSSESSKSSEPSASLSLSSPAHRPQEDLLPLSALQHYLYCPRQCALIHLERLWTENVFTAQGRLLHDRTDTPQTTIENGIKIARSLQIRSYRLEVYGVCDVVEFRSEGPVPIEYKRGKPKVHRADEVQLCAQAMALEEIFDVYIGEGLLFYGQTRRRCQVTLDDDLRQLTHQTAMACHQLIDSGKTPAAEYQDKLCSACSLRDLCLPKRKKEVKNIRQMLANAITE